MDTIIEFVGLCVFTTQLVSGNVTAFMANSTNIARNQVVAIMPTVIGDSKATQVMVSSPSSPKKPGAAPTLLPALLTHAEGSGMGVETHTAMLVFRGSDTDLSSIKGWGQPLALHSPPDEWLYIVLSGEQLVFVSDAPETDVNALNHLAIPHLGLSHTLTSSYAPPKYQGAAAVFMISKGTLSVCQAPPPPPTQQSSSPYAGMGRMDTRLTLHPSKNLTVKTASGDKSITFQAGAAIMFGNVPLGFARTRIASANTAAHYMVYCAMTAQAPCNWPAPSPVPTPSLDRVMACGNDLAYRQHSSDPAVAANDYACSNTQWP